MHTLFYTRILLLVSAMLWQATAAEQKAVVDEGKINVRGQPSLIGEVVTQLTRGDQVTVLEYVTNERAKGGEPTNWAKIKLPANTPVWVYSPMVRDGTVSANRLNLRAGPGDNYSVIGRLNRGEKVNTIRTLGDWTEIEAPEIAYAFVDSSLIKPVENAATVAASTPATTTPSPATPASGTEGKPNALAPVSPQEQVAAAAVAAPSTPPASGSLTNSSNAPSSTLSGSDLDPANPLQDALAAPTTEATAATQPAPAAQQLATSTRVIPFSSLANRTLPPSEASATTQPVPQTGTATADTTAPSTSRRIVRREGIVRPTVSIQAPTWYELIHPETKKTIDYLHEEKLGVKLKPFKGQKVIVTGEESVDPRWPNTPILDLETLDIAP